MTPLPKEPGTVILFVHKNEVIKAVLDSKGYWGLPGRDKNSYLESNLVNIYSIEHYVIVEETN